MFGGAGGWQGVQWCAWGNYKTPWGEPLTWVGSCVAGVVQVQDQAMAHIVGGDKIQKCVCQGVSASKPPFSPDLVSTSAGTQLVGWSAYMPARHGSQSWMPE